MKGFLRSMTHGSHQALSYIKDSRPVRTQDDLLYEALTVWETLWYAARLRLPRTMPLAEQAGRVTMVVTALGLQKCRDTLIGAQPRDIYSGCGWQTGSAVFFVMEASFYSCMMSPQRFVLAIQLLSTGAKNNNQTGSLSLESCYAQ